MSKLLENALLGSQKKELERLFGHYEVEAYVASKRKNILLNHVKALLAKPSVLAGIFGAGVAKEVLTTKSDEHSQTTILGFSYPQIVTILTRFV
ncbi:hypothetical protein [Aliiglaciecola litoralis]|uniref:Uncharacterized protein n=1 Tax=Aliiglaciecola litoralis TaxID=582857 RepID=A0ABN1LEP2_9ALTE